MSDIKHLIFGALVGVIAGIWIFASLVIDREKKAIEQGYIILEGDKFRLERVE